HTHGKLSKKGREQARKLAHRLFREKIDVVYCSDLNRTKQTLMPYLKLHKVKVIYTKELREGHMGIFTGKTRDDYLAWKESESGKKWLAKFGKNLDWAFPKGESSKDLQKRAARIVEKIIKKERGKNVLIMTHAKTKIMMLMHLLNREYKTYRKKYNPPNTALSVIYIKDNGNHRARLINNLGHLK
ncbi:MAG: histidine phosphatase family protein, partial [Nanoarchaeota archaeon]